MDDALFSRLERDLAEHSDLATRLRITGFGRRIAHDVDLPALIREAWRAGWTAPAIAREVAATESYVYRTIRETPDPQ